MQTEQTGKTINGVNLQGLHDVIKAVSEQPALGVSRFKLKNRWLGCGLNRSEISSFFAAGEDRTHRATFVFDNDEPPLLLGEDRGANPVEALLHALAGCITTTTVYHAAARGIPIQKIETSLEGDLDLRGFLGLAEDVPKGYQNIRVVMKIVSNASGDEIDTLKNLFRFSPVYDTLTRPVAVEVEVQASPPQ